MAEGESEGRTAIKNFSILSLGIEKNCITSENSLLNRSLTAFSNPLNFPGASENSIKGAWGAVYANFASSIGTRMQTIKETESVIDKYADKYLKSKKLYNLVEIGKALKGLKYSDLLEELDNTLRALSETPMGDSNRFYADRRKELVNIFNNLVDRYNSNNQKVNTFITAMDSSLQKRFRKSKDSSILETHKKKLEELSKEVLPNGYVKLDKPDTLKQLPSIKLDAKYITAINQPITKESLEGMFVNLKNELIKLSKLNCDTELSELDDRLKKADEAQKNLEKFIISRETGNPILIKGKIRDKKNVDKDLEIFKNKIDELILYKGHIDRCLKCLLLNFDTNHFENKLSDKELSANLTVGGSGLIEFLIDAYYLLKQVNKKLLLLLTNKSFRSQLLQSYSKKDVNTTLNNLKKNLNSSKKTISDVTTLFKDSDFKSSAEELRKDKYYDKNSGKFDFYKDKKEKLDKAAKSNLKAVFEKEDLSSSFISLYKELTEDTLLDYFAPLLIQSQEIYNAIIPQIDALLAVSKNIKELISSA